MWNNPAWVVAAAFYLLSIIDAVVTQVYTPGWLAIFAGVTYYLFKDAKFPGQ